MEYSVSDHISGESFKGRNTAQSAPYRLSPGSRKAGVPGFLSITAEGQKDHILTH